MRVDSSQQNARGIASPDYLVSICVVLHNDRDIVESFLREASYALAQAYRYSEVVVVDRHSTDGTAEIVERLLTQLPDIRFLRLSRAYDREIALSAALEHCIGDCVVALDLRRDPVRTIRQFVDRVRDDSDVVVGRFRVPHGSRFRRLLSAWSRKWSGRILDMPLDAKTGSSFGFSRRAVNSLTRIRSKNRFILYDCRQVGYRNVLLDYEQEWRPDARHEQDSLWLAAAKRAQMVVAHSLLPLRVATLLGVAASFVNLLYLVYIFAVVLIKRRIAEGWLTTSITHTVMFLVLFLILSILAEYIGRILEESRDQPLYFIEQETSSTVSSHEKPRLNIV